MKRSILYLWISCLGFWSQASGQNVISTIAGYGAYGFSGDGGPATSAGLSPIGVAVDAVGNLFIADQYNNRIRKVSPSGIITTVAGNGNQSFSGDGGPATSATLAYPSGVAVDTSGNLFIADGGNGRVRKVSASGVISTVAGNGKNGFSGDGGPAISAGLSPSRVAVDGAGNLFIVDGNNLRVRKVSPGGIIATVAGNGTNGFSGDGGPATDASLSYPGGIAVDASGNLFIVDGENERVRKVSAGGIITTFAGNGNCCYSGDGGPAISAALNYPAGVAVDALGNVFIVDNTRIRKVSASGAISTVAGNGSYEFSGDLGPATSAALSGPSSVAVASSGNLFIADSGSDRIREVSASVPAVAATFWVDQAGVNMYASQGAPAQSQPIHISGIAGRSWQATATTSTGGGAWLSISPASGQVPATLTGVIDSSSLMQGDYQGSITIRAPGAIPPSITISVEVQVYFVPTSAYQITNAASGNTSGQNGFGIAQGSLFVIYGDYLGPAKLQQASSFPIPTSLAGTSVQINMSGAAYNSPMIYTSYSQVAAILPSTVPLGDGMLVVTYNGTAASPIPIHVVKSAFGIFTANSSGAGPGVVLDVNSNPLTFAQPAHVGDTVTLWGTGLGPVGGAEAAGPLPGNLFAAEVLVGNQPAAVQYAGRSGCCAALDELVFQVPANVRGCFVPVVVRSGGAVSNFVSMPIGAGGESCSDPVGLTPDLMTKASTGNGLRIGVIAMGPIPALQNAGFSFMQSLSDHLSVMLGTRVSEEELRTIVRASHAHRGRALKALMKKYAPVLKARHIDPETIFSIASDMSSQGVAASFGQGLIGSGYSMQFAAALPPPGTCTAGYESLYDSVANTGTVQPDDAGPQLLLTGPAGTLTLQNSNGIYQLPLGSALTGSSLPSGTYVVSGNGGNDIGAFSAGLQVGSALTWTNKASVGFIDRSAPLTITWSGGPPSGYVLFGGEGSSIDGVTVAFACVADVRNQTLTVPDYVLSLMPHTQSNGMVFLGENPFDNVFSAPGIDTGYFINATNDSKSIGYQ